VVSTSSHSFEPAWQSAADLPGGAVVVAVEHVGVRKDRVEAVTIEVSGGYGKAPGLQLYPLAGTHDVVRPVRGHDAVGDFDRLGPGRAIVVAAHDVASEGVLVEREEHCAGHSVHDDGRIVERILAVTV